MAKLSFLLGQATFSYITYTIGPGCVMKPTLLLGFRLDMSPSLFQDRCPARDASEMIENPVRGPGM